MKEPLEGAQHSKSTDASLSGLRVVLVRTQHPGNIGATARAMKTMGLSDLALVAPQAPPDEQSWAMASGAVDVLDAMQRFDNLAEALADCSQVVVSPRAVAAFHWKSAMHAAGQGSGLLRPPVVPPSSSAPSAPA